MLLDWQFDLRCQNTPRAAQSYASCGIRGVAMPYTCGASDCGTYYDCEMCIRLACEAVVKNVSVSPVEDKDLPGRIQTVLSCAPRYIQNLTARVKAQLRNHNGRWYDVATWCIAQLENSVDCIDLARFLKAEQVSSAPVVLADIKRRIGAGRTNLIEVQRRETYTVRAKTALNAYDAESLRRAIMKADCQGLSLRDVMMEYGEACKDLYTMSDSVVEIDGRVYYSSAAQNGPKPDIRELFGLPRTVIP